MMRRYGRLALMLAGCLNAQPQFEIASIKPIDPNAAVHMTGLTVYPGGRVVIPTTTLKSLITIAYGISYWQLSGSESWMEKEQYDLEARPAADFQPPITNLRHGLFNIDDPRLREMLQALLADRFHLKLHRETKTGKVYLLEKKGATVNIRATDDATIQRRSPGDPGASSIGFAGEKWNMFNTSMPQLAKWAADIIVHAPVIDKTNVTGNFDYRQTARLDESEVDRNGANEGPFFLFLSEMGLKLQSEQGPVETFVIDHAEKPTPN